VVSSHGSTKLSLFETSKKCLDLKSTKFRMASLQAENTLAGRENVREKTKGDV